MESRVWWRAAVATALLLLPWAAVAQPQPITVSASVESNDVAVGEPFLLSIVVDGAQNVPVPVVEVADFRADYLGPSTQVSLVNGRMSTRVTHRYRMIAHEPGQFTLGPFVVGHDDQRFETAPIAGRVGAWIVADEIYRLREEKQKLQLEAAGRDEQKKRMADMDTFLREQPAALTEYDESLVRRLIEKVTVYEDRFTVEFKSGVAVDVNE